MVIVILQLSADDDMIDLSHYMPDCNDLVPRKLLAEIIQARVEELFEMVHEEIKKSGYDGLLPAGLVLTGGALSCQVSWMLRDRFLICLRVWVRHLAYMDWPIPSVVQLMQHR